MYPLTLSCLSIHWCGTDLSSDYLLGVGDDGGASDASGRRRLLAASVVTVQKCIVPHFPFKCPAPANDPAQGVLVYVSPVSTPLNANAGVLNTFTLPVTTLRANQLAPFVKLMVGVRGVDAGFEPNITSGNSTSQNYVGGIANTGDGSSTLAAKDSSSAIHTYYIPKSYVAAPGATTIKVGGHGPFRRDSVTLLLHSGSWVCCNPNQGAPLPTEQQFSGKLSYLPVVHLLSHGGAPKTGLVLPCCVYSACSWLSSPTTWVLHSHSTCTWTGSRSTCQVSQLLFTVALQLHCPATQAARLPRPRPNHSPTRGE